MCVSYKLISLCFAAFKRKIIIGSLSGRITTSLANYCHLRDSWIFMLSQKRQRWWEQRLLNRALKAEKSSREEAGKLINKVRYLPQLQADWDLSSTPESSTRKTDSVRSPAAAQVGMAFCNPISHHISLQCNSDLSVSAKLSTSTELSSCQTASNYFNSVLFDERVLLALFKFIHLLVLLK